MKPNQYLLSKAKSSLKLEIPSKNFPFGKYVTLFIAIVLIALALLCILIIINDFSLITLCLGTLVMASFIYCANRFYIAYRWISDGIELLELDATSNTFYYRKKNKKSDHGIQESSLDQLSAFYWCPQNEELLDDRSYYGISGGRICYKLGGQIHRMGISLSKEEAKKLIKTLNQFLQK